MSRRRAQRRTGAWRGSSGRRHRLAVALVALVALAGCTIPLDDEPRDIATENRRALSLGDANAGRAAGSGRIYLLAPGQSGRLMLRTVPRENAANAEEALRTLFEGPNREEREQGITSMVSRVRLRTVTRLADALSINVTGGLLDLTGDGAIQAIAQIVATATEFDDINSVRLLVDGESRSWPDSNGDPQSGALTIFDYADLIESSQPPFPPIPSQR